MNAPLEIVDAVMLAIEFGAEKCDAESVKIEGHGDGLRMAESLPAFAGGAVAVNTVTNHDSRFARTAFEAKNGVVGRKTFFERGFDNDHILFVKGVGKRRQFVGHVKACPLSCCPQIGFGAGGVLPHIEDVVGFLVVRQAEK